MTESAPGSDPHDGQAEGEASTEEAEPIEIVFNPALMDYETRGGKPDGYETKEGG